MQGKNVLVVSLIGVFIWLVGGALFYWLIENCSEIEALNDDDEMVPYNACPWTFAQAFYFSVQTGMSIGFGLLSESKKASELYSCFHILVGSSFISGALALFAGLMLHRSHHFQSRREREVLNTITELHLSGSKGEVDGGKAYEGIQMSDLCEIMVTHAHYMKMMVCACFKSYEEQQKRMDAYTPASTPERRRQVLDLLSTAADSLPEFAGHQISIASLQELDNKVMGFHEHFFRGLRKNRNILTSFCAFVIWIAVGTIWSATANKTDFITSLYFSIATLSTAGMVATSQGNNDGGMMFVALFALTGIPVYCTFLGHMANYLVDMWTAQQMKDKMEQRFEASEVAYLQHLADHEKPTVNFAQFAEMQLLRMGCVDRDTIRALRKQFAKLDTDHNGEVPLSRFIVLPEGHPASNNPNFPGSPAGSPGAASAASS